MEYNYNLTRGLDALSYQAMMVVDMSTGLLLWFLVNAGQTGKGFV